MPVPTENDPAENDAAENKNDVPLPQGTTQDRLVESSGGDQAAAPISPGTSQAETGGREPTIHVSVMPTEVLESLNPQPGDTIADGTLGGGGHSGLLLDAVEPNGLVVAADRDENAIEVAEKRFHGRPFQALQGNFCDFPELLTTIEVDKVDGVLLDLGLSSDQLADYDRGFSFHSDGDLDLRFDVSRGEPAWRFVNRLSEKHLADILYQYGEERQSRRIARRVVERRREAPIRSARAFAEIVRSAVRRDPRQKIDSATRSFQALRIAVNEELKSLEIVLRRIPSFVRIGGVAVIISFHSLEDRLVKNAFRDNPSYEVVTRKPLRPSPLEVTNNPRSRSAKLRVAKILAQPSVPQ